jgi:hypothetical protein
LEPVFYRSNKTDLERDGKVIEDGAIAGFASRLPDYPKNRAVCQKGKMHDCPLECRHEQRGERKGTQLFFGDRAASPFSSPAEEESADLDDSDGIATLDSEMGAP